MKYYALRLWSAVLIIATLLVCVGYFYKDNTDAGVWSLLAAMLYLGHFLRWEHTMREADAQREQMAARCVGRQNRKQGQGDGS